MLLRSKELGQRNIKPPNFPERRKCLIKNVQKENPLLENWLTRLGAYRFGFSPNSLLYWEKLPHSIRVERRFEQELPEADLGL